MAYRVIIGGRGRRAINVRASYGSEDDKRVIMHRLSRHSPHAYFILRRAIGAMLDKPSCRAPAVKPVMPCGDRCWAGYIAANRRSQVGARISSSAALRAASCRLPRREMPRRQLTRNGMRGEKVLASARLCGNSNFWRDGAVIGKYHHGYHALQ